MNKVYICGLISSAKGTLRALLDGHPKIVNNPFDFGACLLGMDLESLVSIQNKEAITKSLYELPELSSVLISIQLNNKSYKLSLGNLFLHLFSSDKKYVDLFDVSFSNRMRTPMLNNKAHSVQYNFSVINFFNDFIDKVLTISNFKSIEQLQDTLYEALIYNCASMKKTHSVDSYFLQSSYNGFKFIENIMLHNSSSKIIAVVRDPIALCYSNNKRIMSNLSTHSDENMFNTLRQRYSLSLFSRNFIQRVKHYNDNIYSLQQSNELIHIVNTDDLIENTESAMDSIADFIGIERNNILYTPTVAGSTCDGKMSTLIGAIHDNPYQVLTKNQINLLKFYFYGRENNSLLEMLYINFDRMMIIVLHSRLALILYKCIKYLLKK